MKKSAFKEINKISSFLKKLSVRDDKLKFLKYRFQWNYLPKFHMVSKFPTHVDIETTNKCNLRCVMCPHGFPTQEFKKSLGSMSFDLIRQVIAEGSKKGMASIKLNWRGEPLLWKEHLAQTIRYAKERGIIEVIVNTNGLLLDDGLSREIIMAGLDQIIFSLDGNSAETYEGIRRGGNFNKLVKNIEKFLELRNSFGASKPLVRVQMVKMNSNIHEVEPFINRWSPLVDLITFQDYTNRGEDTERLHSERDVFERVGRRACPQIWQRIIVTWDGKVVMCCRDWESKNVLGELDYSAGRDLEYFWRGKRLSNIRRLHLKGGLDDISACSKCSYKESFQWQKCKGNKK
jgi:wyosine [tRNA(Phe)-imidazoG37] synthetase (radical SAM superfamily)